MSLPTPRRTRTNLCGASWKTRWRYSAPHRERPSASRKSMSGNLANWMQSFRGYEGHVAGKLSEERYNFIGKIDFPRNLAGIAKKQPHDTEVSCGCRPTKKTSLSGTPLSKGLFFALSTPGPNLHPFHILQGVPAALVVQPDAAEHRRRDVAH